MATASPFEVSTARTVKPWGPHPRKSSCAGNDSYAQQEKNFEVINRTLSSVSVTHFLVPWMVRQQIIGVAHGHLAVVMGRSVLYQGLAILLQLKTRPKVQRRC